MVFWKDYEVIIIGGMIVAILLFILPESTKTCYDMILAKTSIC
jgi:hypothetical protein